MRSPQATYAQAHHNLLLIFYFRILHKEHSGFPPFVALDIDLIQLAFFCPAYILHLSSNAGYNLMRTPYEFHSMKLS